MSMDINENPVRSDAMATLDVIALDSTEAGNEAKNINGMPERQEDAVRSGLREETKVIQDRVIVDGEDNQSISMDAVCEAALEETKDNAEVQLDPDSTISHEDQLDQEPDSSGSYHDDGKRAGTNVEDTSDRNDDISEMEVKEHTRFTENALSESEAIEKCKAQHCIKDNRGKTSVDENGYACICEDCKLADDGADVTRMHDDGKESAARNVGVGGTTEKRRGPLAASRRIGLEEKAKSALRVALQKTSEGYQWLRQDMLKPHLFYVKLIFLLQSASLVTLFPYVTLHMRSLGFTMEDTALVNTAVPLADVVGPPVAGLLADAIGNFAVFMSVVTALNGVAALALLFVPPVNQRVPLCCGQDGKCYHHVIEANNNSSSNNNSSNPLLLPQWWNGSEAVCTKTVSDGRNSTTFNVTQLNSWPANNTSSCPSPDHAECTMLLPASRDVWTTSFSAYLSARAVLDILRASSLMLFEGAVVVIIKEHGGDYGLQKLFGTAGAVVFGPLAGKLIDVMSSSTSSGQEDYSAVFYLYLALRLLVAVLMLKLTLDFKRPAKKVLKNLGSVLFRFDVLNYLWAFGVAGAFFGFLETYLFWHMQDLGSTKLTMGLSLMVGTLTGVPLTIFSRLIVTRLGHHFVVVAALALYAFRLFGYSVITSPEMALVFEVSKPVCTTLLLISAMTFVKDASGVSTAASLEGVFGSLHFGVGRGVGGLVGGFAWHNLGKTLTFQAFATAAAGSAVLYLVAVMANRTVNRGREKTTSVESEQA